MENVMFIDPKTPSPSKVSRKPKVLCIDDSQTIQIIVARSLSLAGYQVIGNTDPLKGVMFLLEGHNPDIIIMDIKMPNVGGYKLLKLIKNSTKLKDIPVIMLTSQNKEFDKMKAKTLGAVAYVTKPFSCNHLIETVNQVLSSYTNKKYATTRKSS
ncbi:MAG: response regulator [Prochloraceae cyanobacterium]